MRQPRAWRAQADGTPAPAAPPRLPAAQRAGPRRPVAVLLRPLLTAPTRRLAERRLATAAVPPALESALHAVPSPRRQARRAPPSLTSRRGHASRPRPPRRDAAPRRPRAERIGPRRVSRPWTPDDQQPPAARWRNALTRSARRPPPRQAPAVTRRNARSLTAAG